MRSAVFVIALVVLVALVGCRSEQRKAIPEDLVGVWRTTTPKYADRPFEFTRTTVTFGTGGGESYTRTVVAVTKAQEDGNVVYTVYYKDPEDTERYEFKFSFYYDPANPGVIRWKNQREMAWTKERP